MMDVVIILATIVLALLLIYYLTRPSDFATKQGIQGPWSWPIFGNLFLMMRIGILEFDLMCRRKYGKLAKQTILGATGVRVYDLELVKQIMIKESSTFEDHYTSFTPPKPFDKGLTALKGEDWRRVRHAITPTFTSGKLKKMTSIINRSVDLLMDKIDSRIKNGEELEIKDIYSRFTMTVIADTMFGMEINPLTDESDVFVKHSKNIMNLSIGRTILFILKSVPGISKILDRFPDWLFDQEAIKFFLGVADRAISERRGKENEFHDFLSLMLKCEIADDSETKTRGLTNVEMIAQSIFFMIAGYETTSIALTYVTYLLALHPEYQDRIREEISSTYCDDTPEQTYESLSRLACLDQCFKESLRLYPPGALTDRVANRDITIGSLHVPKGCQVVIPIYAILRDPDLWEEPEKFYPERFAGDDGDVGKIPFHYLVFGAGPRNCIGMRFAILEAKLAMVNILRKFRFVTCENTPEEPLEFGVRGVSVPKKPIILKAESIN